MIICGHSSDSFYNLVNQCLTTPSLVWLTPVTTGVTALRQRSSWRRTVGCSPSYSNRECIIRTPVFKNYLFLKFNRDGIGFFQKNSISPQIVAYWSKLVISPFHYCSSCNAFFICCPFTFRFWIKSSFIIVLRYKPLENIFFTET